MSVPFRTATDAQKIALNPAVLAAAKEHAPTVDRLIVVNSDRTAVVGVDKSCGWVVVVGRVETWGVDIRRIRDGKVKTVDIRPNWTSPPSQRVIA